MQSSSHVSALTSTQLSGISEVLLAKFSDCCKDKSIQVANKVSH